MQFCSNKGAAVTLSQRQAQLLHSLFQIARVNALGVLTMQRLAFFAYGVACHVLFLAVYAWFCAFTGNLWLPKTIDTPTATATGPAVAINIGLLLAFGWSHSIMARPAFKRMWTRLVPQPIE